MRGNTGQLHVSETGRLLGPATERQALLWFEAVVAGADGITISDAQIPWAVGQLCYVSGARYKFYPDGRSVGQPVTPENLLQALEAVNGARYALHVERDYIIVMSGDRVSPFVGIVMVEP